MVYLAQHGYDVVGIDFVGRAIDRAGRRARLANVNPVLKQANVLEPIDLGEPFDFVLDIRCFHNFDEVGRLLYARNISQWTHAGSIFLLYAFFPATTRTRRFGITPQEVRETFAPSFEMTRSTVDEMNREQDSAWYRFERSAR